MPSVTTAELRESQCESVFSSDFFHSPFYVKSDEKCLTKTEGVFTAGDCRTKSVRQIATAVADGAVAALAACEYIG